MALQPLSLVPAAYRPLGTNQRLCSGDTAGLPRSGLPPLFLAPLWLGLSRSSKGGRTTTLISFCLSPGPRAQWVSPRGRQYQWTQLIFLQVPCVVSPDAISPTGPSWSPNGQIISKATWKLGPWDPLVPSPARRLPGPSLAKREKEASGVRMRKVLSKRRIRGAPD